MTGTHTVETPPYGRYLPETNQSISYTYLPGSLHTVLLTVYTSYTSLSSPLTEWPLFFCSRRRKNVFHHYGVLRSVTIVHPAHHHRVFIWLLGELWWLRTTTTSSSSDPSFAPEEPSRPRLQFPQRNSNTGNCIGSRAGGSSSGGRRLLKLASLWLDASSLW